MIDVILDARMARHSGIGTYVRGLAEGFRGQSFFQNHSLRLAGPPPFGEIPFHSPVYSLREQAEYPLRLRLCRLWHAPHYNVPLVKNRARLVVTIHDLIHWIFRKEFYSSLKACYARILFKRVVQRSERIIAVSHQTREDLIQYFKAPPARIRVIPEGVMPGFFHPPEPAERKKVLEKYKLPEAFFLYVGLIKPHKNVKRLVEVFMKLCQEKKLEADLVLVGKKDRDYPKGFKLLQKIHTGEGIHYLPQVESQDELSSLYAQARALVHPSLYEGFGLTCLEAMASGTPVIVSRAASLPEVVGEAGYYIDPYSEASLREALLEMDQNETLRRELREKGRLRAHQFSWAKAARETIQIYEELLG